MKPQSHDSGEPPSGEPQSPITLHYWHDRPQTEADRVRRMHEHNGLTPEEIQACNVFANIALIMIPIVAAAILLGFWLIR